MNAAVDFSILDAQLQQQLIESYRDMMKDAVDTFVDALAEDILSEKKMTLMDITQAISKAQPALLKAAMEGLIQAKHGDVLSQQQAECPCCQKKVNRSARVRHKKVTAWENASNLRNCWTQVSHMYNMQGHGLAVKNTGAPCDRGGGG
jgi:hypothetical protein